MDGRLWIAIIVVVLIFAVMLVLYYNGLLGNAPEAGG
jgi:hypothetical protein